MVYYKVILQGDGEVVITLTPKGKRQYRTLIAGELYTFNEVKRFNIPLRYVVAEQHKPKETFMVHGVRRLYAVHDTPISAPQNSNPTAE